jgi:Cu(I)/Ag(I) efflux system membrane fusion protein
MTGKSGVMDKRGIPWRILPLILLIAAVFGLGVYIGTLGDKDHSNQDSSKNQQEQMAQAEKDSSIWTCSMHPQIKLPKPGKCPICFMDLIPLKSDSDGEESPLRFTMSQRAKTLAQVRTSVVKRDVAKVRRRMVGMVFENETKVAALTSRIDGRLDRVFIDFVGAMVQKGDPMVTIWSPTLIRSQVELFQTLKSTEYDEQVAKGAEEKLAQFGLTQEQIEEIKNKKEPILYVTLRAPISGVVMKKNALLGHFVEEGTEMFIISDLSTVWVKLDAYESDLPWIRYGQKVTFTTPAVPGRVFNGTILFIDPVLQMETRSVKIRVEAQNPDLLLKPHMLVTAEVQAEIDANGRVIKPDWANKAVCPVHPDVTGEKGQVCPTSNRKLKPPTAFGYATDSEPELPLVIPATAVLFTGARSVVYVEVQDTERPTYELRDVRIGPRAGEKYVVLEGLKEGEKVVTYGNFKIDSAMQILARPSMMNPERPEEHRHDEKKTEEEIIEPVQVSEKFLTSLSPSIKHYLELKEALVEGKIKEAKKSAGSMVKSLEAAPADSLSEEAAKQWNDLSGKITKSARSLSESGALDVQRKLFDPLSENLARLLMAFKHNMDSSLYVFLCPMAFNNRGAYWIEDSEDLRNPYFGHEMLKCGELIERIPSESKENSSPPEEQNQKESVEAPSKEGSDTKQMNGSQSKRFDNGSSSK